MGHHYVPRAYLRGFATDESEIHVWQFDKRSLKFSSRPLAIPNVAQQREFYDPETEQRLAQMVEVPGNDVLRKLRSGDLNLLREERMILCAYIATAVRRVPRMRERGHEIFQKAAPRIWRELKDSFLFAEEAGALTSEQSLDLQREIERIEGQFKKGLPDPVVQEIQKPWPSFNEIVLLSEMRWRFVTGSDEHHFVTGDNPVAIHEWLGYGGSEDAEVAFPISTSLAVIGQWRVGSNRSIIRDNQIVKEINRRVIQSSTRFVFCCDRYSWIPLVAKNRNHFRRVMNV